MMDSNLSKPKGYNSPFMQRHAPNGLLWAEYVAPAPPMIIPGGRPEVIGAWAEVVYAGVVFELTNPGWDQLPAYKDNGPVGWIIEYLNACGYGQHASALESCEEYYSEELKKPSRPGSRAFLLHKARNGQTWEEYLRHSPVEVNPQGLAHGAWGECITAAVIFEHENPAWNDLGPYSEDGPAGQVIAFLGDCGQNNFMEQLSATEDATHHAADTGGKLPVFNATFYQPPVHIMQAAEVNRPPPRVSGRKKALCIGCNYPGSSAQLKGCVNDVNRWTKLLMNMYQFPQESIVQLTDEGHNNYQKFPSRSNYISAVRWLVSGAEPGDVLFFQFSGHGGQQESQDDSEADGKDEVLIPTDYKQAGTIVDHELFDLLCVPLPSGCKLTVILDCCHSGSALDLPFVWNENRGTWETERYPWHTAGDVQMFSGCEDSQCSMDAVSRAGIPAGAMTTAMCDVLEQHANDPPGPYDALLGGLTNVLVQRGYEQRPRLSSSQAFDVNQKPFSIVDHIVPNMNPRLGQAQTPHGSPARPNMFGGLMW